VLTDIGEKACRNLTQAEQERLNLGGVSVQECPAPPGVRLFVVDSGSRTWPVLGWQQTNWSLEPIVSRYSPGDNAMIGSPPADHGRPRTDKAEWLVDSSGTPTALTFRVSGRTAEGRWKSRLFAVRLGASGVCLIGVFDEPDANRKSRRATSVGMDCLPDAPLPSVQQPSDAHNTNRQRR
jgi:hypothetical protein